MMSQPRFLTLASTLAVMFVTGLAASEPDYRAEIEEWRAQREAALKADNGWLSLAGLFFLKEGENSFGSDPLNDIVLPRSAPAEMGVFEFDGDTVTVRAAAGGTVTVNGTAVRSAELRPAGPADRLTVGDLTMFVHRSGERYAIRLRDLNSDSRTNFTGLRWFPVTEKYRITAQFVPHGEPKKLQVPNILGDVENYTSSGYVVFTLDGQEFRMEPATGGDQLFFIFRDQTAGNETYPAVRFLYADPPKDGNVLLDFNRAINPPCAFNPYTTCPLPPPQNRLRVRIEAGELNYHGSSDGGGA